MIKEAIEKIIENSYGNDPEYFYKCNKTDNLTFADRRLIALNQELDIQCIYTQRTLAPERFKHQIYVLYSDIVVGISLKDGNLSYSQMKKSNIEAFIESIIEIPASIYDVSDEAKNRKIRELFRMFVDNSPVEYKLNTIDISKGYNLENLPTSCMKGQGYKFKPLDTMGKMYYLTSNKTDNILARCIVWDSNIVFESRDDMPIDCQLHDKVYQLEGKYGEILKNMLYKEGILSLDGLECIDTWDLYIENPFKNIKESCYPWMDRFSLWDKELNRLYYYNWNVYGHNSNDLRELASEVNAEDYRVLLSTDGYTRDIDESDGTVWSEYENRDIDEDDAVWSDNLDSHISSDCAIWSQTEQDYYHEDDYGNGWYYNWNNRDEPIDLENSDYVEFQDVDGTRYMIPKCDAVEDMIGELDTDYIPRDMSIEVKSLGPNYFIYNDYLVRVVREHFENCLANGQGDAEEFAQIVRDLGGEWDYDEEVS